MVPSNNSVILKIQFRQVEKDFTQSSGQELERGLLARDATTCVTHHHLWEGASGLTTYNGHTKQERWANAPEGRSDLGRKQKPTVLSTERDEVSRQQMRKSYNMSHRGVSPIWATGGAASKETGRPNQWETSKGPDDAHHTCLAN